MRKMELGEYFFKNYFLPICFSFPFETNIKKSVSFLEVKIHQEENQLETSVFSKPSDTEKFLNPEGECPDRYKRSGIRAYLHIKISCKTHE